MAWVPPSLASTVPDVRTKVKEGGSRQKLQPYTSDEVMQGATEGTVHVRPARPLLDSDRTARKLKLTFGALDELLKKQLEGLPQTNAGRGRSRSSGSAVTLFSFTLSPLVLFQHLGSAWLLHALRLYLLRTTMMIGVPFPLIYRLPLWVFRYLPLRVPLLLLVSTMCLRLLGLLLPKGVPSVVYG
jgi:hypothetical protein